MITHKEAKRAFGNAMVAQCEDECNFNCNIVNEYFRQEEKKDIIVKDDLIDFIINVIVEADEYGLEPTIPCDEEGKDITKRWSSRLKQIISLWEELS